MSLITTPARLSLNSADAHAVANYGIKEWLSRLAKVAYVAKVTTNKDGIVTFELWDDDEIAGTS